VQKSGYTVTLQAGSDGSTGTMDACNGVAGASLISSWYATAEPITPGGTGNRYFWVGTLGTIFADATGPITSTDGTEVAPGGAPIQ